MPIVVQHGVPEGLTPRIPITARATGDVGRRAGVGGARGAAGGRDPAEMKKLGAFYGRQAAEQQHELQIQKMQEQARIQAELFEYKFTAQQRQELARFNNNEMFIDKAVAEGHFSEEEGVRARSLNQQLRMGIGDPKAMPKDPNKPVYPEGQDIGETWLDEWGNVKTRKPTGEVVTQVPWKETEPGILRAHEQKMELEQAKQQDVWEKERRKYEIEWATEDISEMEPGEPGGFLGIGAKEAGPTGRMRKRRPEEVEALLQRFFPRELQQPATEEEMEQELQRRADIAVPWWKIPEKQGIEVTDADKQLPSDVGRAKAYMRYFRDTYGSIDKIPPEIKPQVIRFAKILRDYKAQSGM